MNININITKETISIIISMILIMIFMSIYFGLGDMVKASFEGETDVNEVWTDLDVKYYDSLDYPLAIVSVTFHNNKVFQTTVEDFDEYCYSTYNFTSFDFRLRDTGETDTYPYGLESLEKEDVDLSFGESYEMSFHVTEGLIEGEPIDMELTAVGYEEDGKHTTIEENLLFTLEPPIFSEPEETPGLGTIFVIFSVLFAVYIIKKE